MLNSENELFSRPIYGKPTDSLLKDYSKVKTPKGIGTNAGTQGTGSKNVGTSSGSFGKTVGNSLNFIGSAGSMLGKFSAIGASNLESRSKKEAMIDSGIDSAADAAISSGNPYAMAAGLLTKGVGLGIKSFVKVPSILKDFKVDQDVSNSSAFSGTSADASRVAKRAGEMGGASFSRIGWGFGSANRDKIEADNARKRQNQASLLLQNNDLNNKNALANMDYLSNTINLQNNGYNLKNISFGKNGMKINLLKPKNDENVINNDISMDFGPLHIQGIDKGYLKQDFKVPAIKLFKSLKGIGFITPFVDMISDLKYTNSLTPEEKISYEKKKKIELRKLGPSTSELEKSFDNTRFLRNGGKINVIVNGKLHKELHSIKSKHVDDIELTRKGIPVVLESGGEIVKQTAEVERDELIITLELTKKLERLKSLGDDEAAIEAGKILAYEIIKNTRDSKNKIIKNA